MSALAWVAIGVAAWLAVVTAVLVVLTAARRADESAERTATALPEWAIGPPDRTRAAPVRIEASSHWLAQRTADAQRALRADRIAVVVHDTPHAWVVESCGGVPGLGGSVLAADSEPEARAAAASALLAPEAGDWSRWTLGAAAIFVGGDPVGVIVVATRRAHGLTGNDQELLLRFAQLLSGHLGRRAGAEAPTA